MADIEPADPRAPGAVALLRQHHALMLSLFPADACHFLDVAALATPDIRFFIARDDGAAVATGALALRPGYGEVKSMFAAPEVRGQGIGRAMLARIEAEARGHGLPLLRLETGVGLDAALRLYRAARFTDRGTFGGYPESRWSLFMEKRLS